MEEQSKVGLDNMKGVISELDYWLEGLKEEAVHVALRF